MKYRLRVSRFAEHDLDAIASYIRDDNPLRAETFIEEIASRFTDIVERPHSFSNKDHWAPNLRSARHGNYLVLFRLQQNSVEIVRVLHGARDIAGIFRA